MKKIAPYLLLATLVIAWFFPLFYPSLQLYITPDTFVSDVAQFTIPFKYSLNEALHKYTLPFWSDKIGTGFPIYAEGQVGTWIWTNFILNALFSPVIAINGGYIAIFITLALGIYILAKELKYSTTASLLSSIAMTFSGWMIVKIPHYNNIQAVSLMSWIVWIVLKMIHNSKTKWWVALPFMLFQMLVVGHMQYLFLIALTIAAGWWLYGSWTKDGIYTFIKQKEQKVFIIKIIGSVCLAILLSAIQLIPTFEMYTKSMRGIGSITGQSRFGMSLQSLIQLVNPTQFGDITKGTYIAPLPNNAPGFWENYTYIGIIPLVLAILSGLWFFKDKKIKGAWILILFCILIALEDNSPIYFIYSFPPFSWFRVYARILSIISILLCLLAGYSMTKIEKNIKHMIGKSIFISLCIFGTVFDLWAHHHTYNPTMLASDIIKRSTFFPSNARIMTFGQNMIWNNQMKTKGWQDIAPYYSLLESGFANYSLVKGMSTIDIIDGLRLEKQQHAVRLAKQINIKDEKQSATVSAESINQLQLMGVNYISSPYALTTENDSTNTLSKKESTIPSINIYEVPNAKSKIYISSNPTYGKTLNEYTAYLKNPSTFDAFITTEKQITSLMLNEKNKKEIISSKYDTDMKKSWTVTTTNTSYLVMLYYLYPGWHAYIDGVETTLYPANLSSMAILLPAGTHEVTITYIPMTFYYGAIVSAVGALIYLYLILKVCALCPYKKKQIA